ncbi:hypothetical protein BVI434_1290010 [Burkholderia vietnamiensis]|nr:hypothetical protein BVI434_1290010 [Burkholderia vietnamiensis]
MSALSQPIATRYGGNHADKPQHATLDATPARRLDGRRGSADGGVPRKARERRARAGRRTAAYAGRAGARAIVRR